MRRLNLLINIKIKKKLNMCKKIKTMFLGFLKNFEMIGAVLPTGMIPPHYN